MFDLPLLSRAQIRRIEPQFPRLRGLPFVDEQRVISGIIYTIWYGLQCNASTGYRLSKTLHNRFIR